jgi:hypothetical protein
MYLRTTLRIDGYHFPFLEPVQHSYPCSSEVEEDIKSAILLLSLPTKFATTSVDDQTHLVLPGLKKLCHIIHALEMEWILRHI